MIELNTLLDFDYDNQKKYHDNPKNVSPSEAISFRKSEGEMVLEATLNPESKDAVNTSGSSYGSYAFAAKRNSDGKVGMVTAGHVIKLFDS
ncbi:hypothetical protein [Sphingobacterium sp.]|uniref:hypothetical protein n=1 Tax=Sphingobacterium sp. TaxID=341027 RepID=UPI002FDD9A69